MADAEKLKSLAAAGDRDVLEEAWLEALENPGPASQFLDAVDMLPEETRDEVSQSLLPLVLETYVDMDRPADALAVARRLTRYEPESRPLRRILLKMMRQVHRGEPWLEVFLKSSGLDDEVPLDRGLALFDSYEPYKPGCPVEHGAGWGPGVVDGYNDEDVEVRIRFHDGIKRELPLSSALDSLKPMDRGNLRAMYMIDPEGVKELAQSDPGLLVHKAVALRRGPVTAAKVKEALVDRAVPAGQWTRWWTGAKKAAARNPYLKIEGGSRPVFTLRDKPVSMHDASLAAVREARGLEAAVATVRKVIASSPDKELLGTMMDEVGARLEKNGEIEPAGVVLDAALLMEEHGRTPPVDSGALFRAAGEDLADGVRLLAEVPGDRGRRLGLHAFEKAFPDDWADRLAAGYVLLTHDLLTPAAEALIKAGKGSLLADVWRGMEAEPWKQPWPLYHLGRKIMGGELSGEGSPFAHDAVLALLRCLESTLFYTGHDRLEAREVTKRYEELLLDSKKHFLDTFIEKGERPMLERALSMVHVTTKLPRSITDRLLVEIPVRFPDLKQTEERHFWESGAIFCTRAGVQKRQMELKEIMEVKLPENSKAIGRAASFGDLSENAEWTAAIEERELLSTRAKDMEEELRSAQFLEEQTIPDDMVAPGTRTTFRYVESGQARSLIILGPWDGGEDEVISYQAPLAAGLLGKRVGEEAVLNLPEGAVSVTVESVEPAL